MEYRIAIVNQSDVTQLVDLINSAYRGELSKQGWTTEADILGGIRTSVELLSKELQKPGASILKYIDENNEIKASVFLRVNDDRLYLGMLTVSPLLQNQGIGKILLRAAEEHALTNNCDSIYMTVISVRSELIAWYERHGYAKTGEVVPFPMNDPNYGLPKQHLEMIVMEKILVDQ